MIDFRACFFAVCAAPSIFACRGERAPQKPVVDATPEVASAPPREDWGDLPRVASDLEATYARPDDGLAAPRVEELLAVVDGNGLSKVAAGHDPIARALEASLARGGNHDGALLVGSHHDSSGQLDAFRRLVVGASSIAGLTHVVVEQFEATGHWRNVDPALQRGDSEEIAAFFARGDRASLRALVERQRSHDYAAFKFDALDSVVEIAVEARAMSIPLVGCDLPRAMRPSEAFGDDDVLRLRELHCAKAMERALAASPPPHRTAILWGAEHVGSSGFRRRFPPDVVVVSAYLFGARPSSTSASSVEADLRGRLFVADEILVPLDERGERVSIVLPDAALGLDVDRAESKLEHDEPSAVTVTSTAAGTFSVATFSIALSPDKTGQIPLASGDYAFRFATKSMRWIGALSIPKGGRVELELDPQKRALRVVTFAP